MRIVQVTGLAGPGPVAGGVWQVARLQTEALRSRGHQVELVAGWRSADVPTHVDGTYVSAARVRSLIPGLGLRMLCGIRLARTISQAIESAEVVHLHLCRDFATAFALAVAKRQKKCVVAQSHGMLTPAHGLIQRIYDLFFLRRNAVAIRSQFVLTDDEAGNLAPWIRASPVLIHNAVAEPNVRWQRQDEFIFLFAGRLHTRKQPQVLLQAAEELARTGQQVQVEFAGQDEGELAVLRRRMARPTAGLRTSYLGPLEHKHLQSLMARGRILVLPSLAEPYPMVALAAAALGAPMILTSQSGISRYLLRRSAGLVVPPEVYPVFKAMQKLVEDPGVAGKLGAHARAAYEDLWSLASLVDALENAYARAMEL